MDKHTLTESIEIELESKITIFRPMLLLGRKEGEKPKRGLQK